MLTSREMPTICHFSDWHGQWIPLPKADLYICTGDMLKNYPKMKKVEGINSFGQFGEYYSREIIPSREEKNQQGWLDKQLKRGGLRRFLGNTDAPIVVVRGNHDFVDLAQGFGGEVFEINNDCTRVVEFLNLRIGGVRGINYIIGEWADELDAPTWEEHAKDLPMDLDVLVTHAPPFGVLDAGYGVDMFRRYVGRRYYTDNELPLHCFGHVHEHQGIRDHGTIYSNAATTYNLFSFDITDETVIVDV